MEGNFKDKEFVYHLQISKIKFATRMCYPLNFSFCNLLGERVVGNTFQQIFKARRGFKRWVSQMLWMEEDVIFLIVFI